ncbi:MAG: prepilin-type N-terminal cleavage/methylation domain-containing protein [Deltaproteobacteria bacterium]|nr:prepilin-type N-terminal cleavage/methylation domain-containing protein [Deltaproteobacteria bacterium]
MRSQDRFDARKPRSGFTLIEVLISLVVILFGFMATLTFLTSSYRAGRIAESQTMAVFLAEAKIEELRDLAPASYPDSTAVLDYFDRHGGTATAASAYFTRRVTLHRKSPSQFTNEVLVEIDWPGARPIVYQTIIPSDRKSFVES